jgi:hypothetical protein
MEKWAQGVSYNVGLGAAEVLKGASTIQDLLVPRGFDRATAAAMTEIIYERGAAIAEFSGRDTTEGIDAVTKAILGQGKSLTMMGVEIRKNDVKKWIKENADEVVGLNQKQAEVVATLALIEKNSTDAWTSFQNGAGTADEVLDTFAATLANVKDAAVRGFSGIFVGVVEDILAATDAFGGLPNAANGLTEWIDENEGKIREFMLDLIDWALLGAQAFGDTAKAGLEIAEWLAKAVPDMMRFAAAGIDMSEKLGALYTLLNSPIGGQQFRDAWGALTADTSDRVRQLEEAADRLEQRTVNLDTDPAKKKIDELVEKIGGIRETIQALKESDVALVEIKAELKEEDVEAAEATIAALTEPALLALIASIDPDSASKTEKKILELAKERKSEIDVSTKNAEAARKKLEELSRDRSMYLTVKFRGYDIPYYLARPGLTRTAALPTEGVGRYAAPVVASGAGGYALPVAPSGGSVQINNYYPKPERASDSLAMNLRLAREAVR